MAAINKRQIGKTDIRVSAIGFGGMPLSIDGRPDEAQAIDVIATFVNCGGDFIDTANVYCLDDSELGHNERIIRKALVSMGAENRIVVATKGGLTRPGGRWETDGRPSWLRKSCEQSLRDLNTDNIGLYQLHAVDPKVQFEESLGELIRLKEEGKILHIGLSNIGKNHLEVALTQTPIASVQNRCNPLYKSDFHNGLIEMCADNGVTYIPYSPVGGHHGHFRLPQQHVLNRLSEKYGESTYCISLAWLLNAGTHILPIPGASRVESAKDSARARSVDLAPEDIDAVNGIADS